MSSSRPEIISFDFKHISDNVDYFNSKYADIVSIYSSIEKKNNEVSVSFDIWKPNIKFSAGDIEYISDGNKFVFSGSYMIDINSSTTFESSSSWSPSSESLVPTSFIAPSIQMISTKYLPKSTDYFSVFWGYSSTYNSFDIGEVPSFMYTKGGFHTLIGDNLSSLLVDTVPDSDSVTNVGYLNDNLNARADAALTTKNDTFKSASFTISGGTYSSDIVVESISSTVSSFLGTSQATVLTKAAAFSNYIAKDLSNITSINIESGTQVSDKDENEVVSIVEFSTFCSDTIEEVKSEFGDDFGATSSKNGAAYTWDDMFSYLGVKVSIFYTASISSYIGLGSNNSVVKSLLEQIDSIIEKYKLLYMSNDECSSISPNNADEGCNIACDNLDYSEKNLMTTKQKLKSTMSCMFSCDA